MDDSNFEQRRLLRWAGADFETACERCHRDLEQAAHFDAKFAVLDIWMRGVDAEPGVTPAVVQSVESTEGADATAAGECHAHEDEPAPQAESPPQKEQEAECSRPKFAKYKRLKEAFLAYEGMRSRSPFAALVPTILRLAAAACRDAELTKLQVLSEPVQYVRLSAAQVRVLLANLLLLNIRAHRELQNLYLSSAKAAPQKLLCLLALFETPDWDMADMEGNAGQGLLFERLPCPEGRCLTFEQAESPVFAPTVEFHGSYGTALQRAQSTLIVLSAADTFGKVFDVKTPPEEVVLWEFPELLAVRLLLGPFPLQAGEVYAARGIRHINHCSVDGPLLQFVATAASTEPLMNIVALDIPRDLADLQFSTASLTQNCRKWVAAFSAVVAAAGPVAVSHPHLLGVDHHQAFLVQSLASACVGDSTDAGSLTLHYALGDDYATAQDIEIVNPEKGVLSLKQQKEAKHFAALVNRMKAQGWSVSEVLAMLAVYPFARHEPTQPFHAFWTARLRAATGGRSTAEELADAAKRQEELQPVPCKQVDDEEQERSRSPSHRNDISHWSQQERRHQSRMQGWEGSYSWHSNTSWHWHSQRRREWHSNDPWKKHSPTEGWTSWQEKDVG
mmetsp:Transcript_2185/g.4596  ORF Transcript_2185/g.4596 Transcript_2185/m.4596 type:complete len:618 (+) Transcript_2185:30-1883(+)